MKKKLILGKRLVTLSNFLKSEKAKIHPTVEWETPLANFKDIFFLVVLKMIVSRNHF